MKNDRSAVGSTEDLHPYDAAPRILSKRDRLHGSDLAESKNRQVQVFNILADAVLVYREWTIVYANPAAAQLLGAETPEQLVGKNGLELTHPDDRALVLSRRQELLGGTQTNVIERRGLRLDGSVFLGESRGSKCDWDGAPAVAVVIRNITDRKNHEKALQESEEKYRDLIDGSLLAMLIINADGKRLYVNQAFLDLFGYESAEEILSVGGGGIAAPHDRERLIENRKARLTGEPVSPTYEFDGFRKDGSIVPVQAIARCLVWEGQNAIQRTYIDLTERKRAEEALRDSEERYRKLVELSTDAIYVHRKGRIVLINPAGVKMFGATSSDQIVGKSALDLIHPDFRDTAHRRMLDSAKEGTIMTFQEQERLRIDGTAFTAEVAAIAMEWDGERGAIVIARDITFQKQTEAILLEAKRTAELANRAKSEFLANMSHELRTPLNAIIGFSDMISGETLGPVGEPKYLEYVKDINASGTHLLELINDILDLSKIEAGKHELQERNIDVLRVIRSCLTLVKERAETRCVKIETDTANVVTALFADERNLKQIFLNLLTNAIKFTPAGGKVTITAWSDPDDGYVFQFTDSGIGIAPDDIPNVLASFGQVESALSREQQGTGLGLPLTKSLVEMHGGSLELQSEIGVGTTATVRFPAERIVSKAVSES